MADAQHKHEWVPIREGYPQKICKCGVLRALGIKSGNNTITINPSPLTQEVIRWTSFHNPSVGDLGMNAVGRPTFSNGTGNVLMAAGTRDANFTRTVSWATNPNATTITGSGTNTVMSTEGASVASTSLGSSGWGIQFTTTAALNSDAGWLAGAFTDARSEFGSILDITMRTTSTVGTNVRYWIGLFSGDPMGSATPAVSMAAFRYDTSADGTSFWRTCTSAGAGLQVTTTTSTITTGTTYNLRVVANGSGTWYFFVGGGLIATHSTTVPAATTNMGIVAEVRTLDAVAKNIVVTRGSLICNNISF